VLGISVPGDGINLQVVVGIAGSYAGAANGADRKRRQYTVAHTCHVEGRKSGAPAGKRQTRTIFGRNQPETVDHAEHRRYFSESRGINNGADRQASHRATFWVLRIPHAEGAMPDGSLIGRLINRPLHAKEPAGKEVRFAFRDCRDSAAAADVVAGADEEMLTGYIQ